MSVCKFCNIIESDEERRKEEIVYEDSEFIVLTDKFRKTSVGAICLIIPKTHSQNLLELSEENASNLVKTIALVSRAMQLAYNCKGIRIWTAIDKEAGQSIFHCHIHVVPCKSIFDRIIAAFPGLYDMIRRLLTLGINKSKSKLDFELAEKLREELKAIAISDTIS